jgi:hypothetical protein
VQQVRSRSGDFAALLGKGPSAVQELQQQVRDAEAAMMLLKHSSLKHLIQEVADLNDCHIVVVGAGVEGLGCCFRRQSVAAVLPEACCSLSLSKCTAACGVSTA